MANPFLMTDDEVPQESEAVVNPFLIEAADEGVADEESDNPFFTSEIRNPFADFGAAEEPASEDANVVANPPAALNVFDADPESDVSVGEAGGKNGAVDSAMSFFGTTISDEDEHDHETQGLNKPNALNIQPIVVAPVDDEVEAHMSPRPLPPSRTTQDLILSVSDQLDATSSHLLDRIPVTRTPSPVSMRDLHTPSPTGDLLDVNQTEPESAANNFDCAPAATENPFTSDGAVFMPAEKPRPPPPRPTPPRPSPPRRPSPPQSAAVAAAPPPRPAPPPVLAAASVQQQQPAEPDLFDMFGTADAPPKKPPPPKSNQDILSLFSVGSTSPPSGGDTALSPPQQPKPFVDPNVRRASATSVSGVSPAAVDFKQPSIDASECDTVPDNRSTVSPVVSDLHTTLHGEITPPQSAERELSPLDSAADVSTIDDKSAQLSSGEVSIADRLEHAQDAYPKTTPIPSANPFASPEDDVVALPVAEISRPPPVQMRVHVEPPVPAVADEFDAFAAKFESVKKDDNNLLDGFGPPSRTVSSEFAWGNEESAASAFGDAPTAVGFDANDDESGFDSFLAMSAPPPAPDSDDETAAGGREFNVVIRPRDDDAASGAFGSAALAPPPRGSHSNSMHSGDSSPRVNPFDTDASPAHAPPQVPVAFPTALDTSHPQPDGAGSAETPPTPLFDEDVSQPLEDFPRITYMGDGWEMQLRQPSKKKITGQRFWKKIWLRIVNPHENPVIQLRNAPTDKEPFQELPLQACYSVSDISAQQFDQFGKIFTVKLQYIFYKERAGIRPGQVTKAERLTNKLSQFAAFAIQGDYQGVKEFGSDLKKLGLPVEHAPQVSELFKIGSHNYEDMKQFMVYVDELLFKYHVHRDRALTYKMEEVQVTAVDELYVEQNADGMVMKQICRVRLHFLGFLSGMPTIELGVNDLWRQGKEVVGRHDIIPVVTEEWIRLEGVEFHSCVQQNEYERSRTIRFQPPDACYIELMRFRVRPPKNRELPFQLKAVWVVTGNKVELRADVLVPGFASRKLGQIPCEDVSIRFPIPECWIYLFRVEKHFRYGSVKSAHRRTGKIKGIERILGTVDQLQESLIEVTSGQAKYEHHHRAIVWRCPRLPKEGQGAYTTHQMVVRMALTSYDQIPEQLAPFAYVEFTMPATQVSHMTVRSVSVQDSDSDDPPEKYVRYLARHEYRVGIEHTIGDSMNPYLAATARKPDPPKEPTPAPAAAMPAIAGSDSDSDSN